jgi:serine/threonine protein kinase
VTAAVPVDTTTLSAALQDRYALERELGQGGMAVVFLGRDLKHGRKVAVKVLRPELAAVIGAERFLHEIRSPPTCSTRTSSRCTIPARPAPSSSTSCPM